MCITQPTHARSKLCMFGMERQIAIRSRYTLCHSARVMRTWCVRISFVFLFRGEHYTGVFVLYSTCMPLCLLSQHSSLCQTLSCMVTFFSSVLCVIHFVCATLFDLLLTESRSCGTSAAVDGHAQTFTLHMKYTTIEVKGRSIDFEGAY